MNKRIKVLYSALKDLDENQLKSVASNIREQILESVDKNGGHLSSNLGDVELTIGLLRHFDPEKDDILFDVGHQSYTYKILTGRDLSNLRKTGGIAPFSSTKESKYDKYNNGHAGDSISIGYGISKAKYLSHDESYTISLIGDSSITNGLAMEALNLLSSDDKNNLIIVLNDNGMSIGQNIGYMGKKFQKLRTSKFYYNTSSKLGKSMSKKKFSRKIFIRLRNFKDKIRRLLIKPTVFESMGIKYMGPFDGHDYQSLDLAFIKAKEVSKAGPVIVHILTDKGYGYEPARIDKKGKYHGVSSQFEVTINNDNDDFCSIKSSFIDKKMAEDENIILITPAMSIGSKIDNIQEKYPERFIDVGIAEENAIAISAGLSLAKYKPIVDIYSSFMQRGYDEIIEDIARNDCKVIFFVERAGIVGEDGPSHHGLYDVAMVKSIPNTYVYMPYDENSFIRIYNEVDKYNIGSYFIRFTKDKPYKIDKEIENINYLWLNQNKNKKLVIAVGPMGSQLLNSLDSSFDKLVLINLLPDEKILDTLSLNNYSSIVIYDPYSTIEGSCKWISSYLNNISYKGNVKLYSFSNDFVTFGQNDDLYKEASLDIENMITRCKEE